MRHQNSMQKVTRKLFNIGVVRNPVCFHSNKTVKLKFFSLLFDQNFYEFIANEAADPRGSAVELANHRAVHEYGRKISSQRKGLF